MVKWIPACAGMIAGASGGVGPMAPLPDHDSLIDSTSHGATILVWVRGKGGVVFMTFDLLVNGKSHRVEVDPDESLLTVLRDYLDLTGSKYGCGEGQCGACTVLIDGNPRRSCSTPVRVAVGKRITTIEGLETEGRVHPVQQAFLDAGAMQCGYCTSGMIVTSVALLKSNLNPSRDDIIRFMQGNVCRCGTYQRIIAAIQSAAKSMREVRP
jgi:isoquinoline 1-oxidoreductase subunit alpha